MTFRNTATRVLQVGVGVIFLGSGVAKSWEILDFATVVSYHASFLPDGPLWSRLMALLVCLWEVFLGIALITGWAARWVSLFSLGTLVLFSVVLTRTLIDPSAPSCGCTAWLSSIDEQINEASHGLIRNGVLAALLIGIWGILTTESRLTQNR